MYTTENYHNPNTGQIADDAWDLFVEMQRRFGSDKAWEFVLNFYRGAAG